MQVKKTFDWVMSVESSSWMMWHTKVNNLNIHKIKLINED